VASVIRFAGHPLARGNQTWAKQHPWSVFKLYLGHTTDFPGTTPFWRPLDRRFSPLSSSIVRCERVLLSSLHLVTRMKPPRCVVPKLVLLQSSGGGHPDPNVNGGIMNRSVSYSNTLLGSIHTFHFGSSAEVSQSTSPWCSIQQLNAVELPSHLTQ